MPFQMHIWVFQPSSPSISIIYKAHLHLLPKNILHQNSKCFSLPIPLCAFSTKAEQRMKDVPKVLRIFWTKDD